MNSDSIVVRPAMPEIAEPAARLLYLTMRPLTEYWLGVDDTDLALRALRRLFVARYNLFSHEFAEYASVDGKVAGLVLDYAGRTMTRLERATLLKHLEAAGLPATVRMVRRAFPLHGITEAAPDEYFLAHIAVLPEYESRGLGRLMLHRAEERARSSGFQRITLTVDADNGRAQEMYRRAGWETTGTVQMDELKRRFDYNGFHHMTKKLG